VTKRGFTLVEVLVVVGIIALLAAIVFPVLARAKVASKKAVAISNGGQFSKAILLYAADSDDKTPPYCIRCVGLTLPEAIETGPHVWYVSILPYTGVSVKPSRSSGNYLTQDYPDFYFDPNENRPRQSVPDTHSNFSVFASWGINDFMVNRLGTESEPGRQITRALGSFRNASSTVLCAQTVDYLHDGHFPGVALAVPPYEDGFYGWSAKETVDGFYGSPLQQIKASTPRSAWGSNIVLWLDGSVKLTPKAQLVDRMELWAP